MYVNAPGPWVYAIASIADMFSFASSNAFRMSFGYMRLLNKIQRASSLQTYYAPLLMGYLNQGKQDKVSLYSPACQLVSPRLLFTPPSMRFTYSSCLFSTTLDKIVPSEDTTAAQALSLDDSRPRIVKHRFWICRQCRPCGRYLVNRDESIRLALQVEKRTVKSTRSTCRPITERCCHQYFRRPVESPTACELHQPRLVNS